MRETAEAFDWFADWADDTSPLYARLARRIVEDDAVLDVAAAAPDPGTRPHLLFAAVHARLLDGADTPLREYYPSVVDDPRDPDDRAFDRFREFVTDHAADLRDTLTTRRTQTNAVRRAAALYPAFSSVAAHAADRDEPSSLALLEVGPSAGLNLRWDDYRYDYGDRVVGPDEAPVSIESGIRAGDPPLPATPPRVASRLGVDLNPLDVTTPDDVTWLRALVWPEHTDRHDLLADALAAAREDPPDILAGDAVERLPALVDRLPGDATPVVYNTQVLYQLTDGERDRLEDQIRAVGRSCPLYWVCGEGAHPDYDESIELTIWRSAAGSLDAVASGAYQQHGRWVVWES